AEREIGGLLSRLFKRKPAPVEPLEDPGADESAWAAESHIPPTESDFTDTSSVVDESEAVDEPEAAPFESVVDQPVIEAPLAPKTSPSQTMAEPPADVRFLFQQTPQSTDAVEERQADQ